jgi:hypothetical protein
MARGQQGKKLWICPEMKPPKLTKPVEKEGSVGFVSFVLGHIHKNRASDAARFRRLVRLMKDQAMQQITPTLQETCCEQDKKDGSMDRPPPY